MLLIAYLFADFVTLSCNLFFDFVLFEGANVNGVTSTKDHSVLSLSCAGGHTEVVQLLLAYGADPCQKLKV